jgi:copper chaperone NosL
MRGWGAAGAAALLALAACAEPHPFPIVLGEDGCDHCHMTLVDPRFTAELLTTTGKGYRFDDIGCLAAFLAEGSVPKEREGQAWVNDFLHPGQWLPAQQAVYLRTDSLRTPMGSGLIALSADGPVDSLRAALAGTRLDWAAVRAGGGHGGGSAGMAP